MFGIRLPPLQKCYTYHQMVQRWGVYINHRSKMVSHEEKQLQVCLSCQVQWLLRGRSACHAKSSGYSEVGLPVLPSLVATQRQVCLFCQVQYLLRGRSACLAKSSGYSEVGLPVLPSLVATQRQVCLSCQAQWLLRGRSACLV